MLQAKRCAVSRRIKGNFSGTEELVRIVGNPGVYLIQLGLQSIDGPQQFSLPANIEALKAKVECIGNAVNRVIWCDFWKGLSLTVAAETVIVSLDASLATAIGGDYLAQASVSPGSSSPGALPPTYTSTKETADGGGFGRFYPPPYASCFKVLWNEDDLPVNSPVLIEQWDIGSSFVYDRKKYNVTAALNGERYCQDWIPLIPAAGYIDVTTNVLTARATVVFGLAV
jgi:hypothetical protein